MLPMKTTIHKTYTEDNNSIIIKHFYLTFKKVIILILLLFPAFNAFSQLYISGKFNLPVFAAELNTVEFRNYSNGYSVSNPHVKPLGDDYYSFSADIGYAFTNFFSFDIETEYFDNTIELHSGSLDRGDSNNKYDEDITYSRLYEGFLIRPGFIISTNKSKKIVPYIKIGAVVAVPTDRKNTYTSDKSYYSGDRTIVTEIRKYNYDKIQYGLTSSLGFEIKFSKIIVPFFEAKLDLLSLSPESSELVEWSDNHNNDYLPEATRKQIFTDYVDSYNINDLPDNESNKVLKDYEPFSRIVVAGGIRIYLWKRR